MFDITTVGSCNKKMGEQTVFCKLNNVRSVVMRLGLGGTLCLLFLVSQLNYIEPLSKSRQIAVRINSMFSSLSVAQTFSERESQENSTECLVTEALPYFWEATEKGLADAEPLRDLRALENVTTRVNGFDPLSNMLKPTKFLPVLEARGGTDKDESGHRRDTLPLAHEIAQQSHNFAHSAVFQFLEESNGSNLENVNSNNALVSLLKETAHGVVVRINPGTLSAATHHKIDNILRELSDSGIVVMNHPDISSTLGAKDALYKMRHLKSGLLDTAVYYDSESFREGFRRSISMQSRVIKQNRGSQGEGVWICELENSSVAFADEMGESIVSLDAVLKLTEANDGHIEYHTVAEFLEFCINGRTEASGSWASKGYGKYFDGGIEAGAMIVDQRFLPRIVEGEVRCMMVGSHLVELVHKKPKNGSLSATLQSGAIYTKHEPDDPRFSKLVESFREDAPKIMKSFGFSEEEPLPLLWTADYIPGETDDHYHIGEINSSCVGLTRQLELVPLIASNAVERAFPV